MNTLEEIRKELDVLDYRMAVLFEQRMQLIEKVIAYKKEHGLPVEDHKREQDILKRKTKYIQTSAYQTYYEQWMQTLLSLSKAYQEKADVGK